MQQHFEGNRILKHNIFFKFCFCFVSYFIIINKLFQMYSNINFVPFFGIQKE